MLHFDPDRPAAEPRDAATLVLLRDGPSAVEVFCVKRHERSGFLGGAVVFPGGKVDATDRDTAWLAHCTLPRPAAFAPDADALRALAVAACRETLEEAAMLPVVGEALAHDELLSLRKAVAGEKGALLSALAARRMRVDLAALWPLARWITPAPETRRYDTRFFAAAVGAGQRGAHDERETTASFWAPPAEVLSRFDVGEIQLAPPTHRTLAQLTGLSRAADVAEAAARACLDPICPRLVRQNTDDGETLALALPGDPEHDVREARAPGPSRFVLRGGRWYPQDAPPVTH